MPTKRSALTALAAAMLVFVLTLVVAWEQLRHYDTSRLSTIWTVEEIATAVAAFAEREGHYPPDLSSLDEEGNTRDQWDRPIEYHRTESGFVLRSLGRDGLAGGVGLDGDIVLVEKRARTTTSSSTHSTWELRVPPMTVSESIEHFEFRGPMRGAAIAACFAAFISLFPASRTPRSWRSHLAQLAITVIACVVLSAWLAVVHVPSGH